ncbi:conjugal transfer protein TraG [Allofournierella massiliensis]|uniref:conjugal transfer protein TraG n=1 Tax=Allofournierella massiliensis TaxID=1650663 RepID=UPI003F4EFB10
MTVDWKKKLLPNLPYILFVYLFDKLCQAVCLAPVLDAAEKFLHLSQSFTEAFSSGLPSLHPLDLLVGIAGAVIVRLVVYAKGKNARKYRKGISCSGIRIRSALSRCSIRIVCRWNMA